MLWNAEAAIATLGKFQILRPVRLFLPASGLSQRETICVYVLFGS